MTAPQQPNVMTARVRRLLRRAENWLQHGKFDIASQVLDEALDILPRHPDVLHLKGLALHGQRRFAEAVVSLEQASSAQPGNAALCNALGGALGEMSATDRAIAAFRQATDLAPQHPAYWMNLARALDDGDYVDQALDAIDQVLTLSPHSTTAREMRVRLLAVCGDLDAAAREARALLRTDPASVWAWTVLVRMKTEVLDSAELATLSRQKASTTLSQWQRIRQSFNHAQALDAAGRCPEAWAALVEANAAKRKTVEWDAATFSRMTDENLRAWERPLAQAEDSRLGDEMIFLVGMPRSGSTLIEQILFAHPQVDSAGEVPVMFQLLDQECQRQGCEIRQWAVRASARAWQQLGEAYLDRMASYRKGGTRLTDKGMEKWQYLGVVHAMLPGARFVHSRRDPLETCFSCFKQDFESGQWYCYDIDEMTSAWHDYQRMMAFWCAQLADHIVTLDYEDLTQAPDAEIRRLLHFCDLPWDPACRAFHEARRTIRSASVGQVRKPLHQAVSRAAAYGNLLDPLRSALKRHSRH